MRSWVVLALAGAVAAAPLRAQSTERAPKTAAELQRENGHVWDLAPSRAADAGKLSSRSLRRAVEAFLDGGVTPSRAIDLAWGEFWSGTGKPFLALSLDRADDGVLPVGEQATLFGELLDAQGAVVASFESEVEVERSAARAVVDLALPLPPPGTVRAVIGVARAGKVLFLLDRSLDVRALDARVFALSRPVLATDVYPLPKPQRPDDPFRFGGLRVVPRGAATFAAGEEPWMFVVVRVPGSAATGPPALAASLAIRDGAGKTTSYPIAGPTATPLRGFIDQWGLGVPLPLDRLTAGRYEATLGVEVGGARSEATAPFEVVAAPAP